MISIFRYTLRVDMSGLPSDPSMIDIMYTYLLGYEMLSAVFGIKFYVDVVRFYYYVEGCP